jgi:hypothetical protein
MKQKDLFEIFFHFRFWRNDFSIWILSVESNRFLFVFMFIKVEDPCSLSLLSPHYAQEFHFYPTWGNLPRFADPWSSWNLVNAPEATALCRASVVYIKATDLQTIFISIYIAFCLSNQ